MQCIGKTLKQARRSCFIGKVVQLVGVLLKIIQLIDISFVACVGVGFSDQGSAPFGISESLSVTLQQQIFTTVVLQKLEQTLSWQLFGWRYPCDIEQCWYDVQGADQRVAAGIRLYMVGMADDKGGADGLFCHEATLVKHASMTCQGVAVVAGEQDDGVLGKTCLVEGGQDFTDGIIDHGCLGIGDVQQPLPGFP